MTIANIITIGRILLVPIFLVVLLTEMQNKEIIAFIVFLIASITDAVDGYYARKLNQITELGKFLDPLADKLLIAGALLALVYLDFVATWVAAVIIMRELFITAFRFYFLVKESTFSASWLAKKKTLVQIISISLLILHPKLPYAKTIFEIATYILYFAVFLTIYSGLEYVIKYSKTDVVESELKKKE
ncbi:MAG: CDP-diacylglycerol--glycerol-3-phosphate 3-phosphatidyltransferase [bacterium]|nr:CDP-diacylglycerol--glycerol-3-phosphate 3-phosphatidyltransferase [bacterium]